VQDSVLIFGLCIRLFKAWSLDHRGSDLRFRIQGAVLSLGLRIRLFGFRVQSIEFQNQGAGFVEFEIQGAGFEEREKQGAGRMK